MRGVHGERRQHGEDAVHEPFFQPFAIRIRQVWPVHNVQMRFPKACAQRLPGMLLSINQGARTFMNGSQLLRRGQPIWRLRDKAGAVLPDQPGHAHGIEFIQVIG